MFTISDIDPAIIHLDNEIKKYAATFSVEKIAFDKLTSNIAFLSNERTVSTFCNDTFNAYIVGKGFSVELFANEFSILIKNGINIPTFNQLITDVYKCDPKRDKPWNRCYVDGYFKIDNFLKEGETTHVFAEYKMDNSFVYLDLATDYLKYKVITYANELGTTFVYTILKKQENYPSILSVSAPHYEFIGKTISPSSVSGTKQVYIYNPVSSPVGQTKPSITELERAVELMCNIVTISDEIDELKAKCLKKIPDEKLIFINKMRAFNSKVVKSKCLKSHYGFIKDLWNKCSEKKIFDNLSDIFSDCEKPLNPETIIEEGSRYKTNFGHKYTNEASKAAIENGLWANPNISLITVIFLDYFNERFDIGALNPVYKDRTIGKGKNQETIFAINTVSKYKEFFKKNYAFDDGDRRLKKLAYSVMYYIVNTFEIIYDIDKNENKALDYKEEFRYYLALEKLQTSLNGAMRELKFDKNKKIDAEEILDGESKSTESHKHMIDFVNWIINKY